MTGLSNRTAIVTGGAKGIGRAICLRLARDGAAVGIIDVSGEAADATVSECATLGAKGACFLADVTDYDQVKAAVDVLTGDLGQIDILVNNAGIAGAAPFVDTDELQWRRVIDVNYVGFLNVTRAVLPQMIEQEAGAICSIGSDAGRVGNRGETLYCGTKAAVMASSKALARELARFNIRVNCVAPGPVETELWANLHPGEKGARLTEAICKAIPMGRIGAPEDVANVVAFLVGDDSSYMTGQVVSVDGGLTMIG